jgi:hypothetical protein
MSVTVPWKASSDNHVNGVAAKIDEVRQSLSKEAERLAQMADDYSQKARSDAADTADDLSVQAKKSANEQITRASGWANDLLRAAASLGTALALSSRKTAQDLGDTAQDKAKDLRNLRLTTEPKRTGPDFAPGISLLAGFGAGFALMYYLDPEKGKARRNLLRDKVMSWSHKAAKTARGTAIDVSNRAQGAIHETSNQLKGQMMANDLDIDPNSETQTWRTSAGDGGEYANSSWPESLPEESVSH